MVTVKRAYVEGLYGQVHYRMARPSGAMTAPPLLCLHQTPTSGRDFAALMGELAATRLVVAPDTPGYGQSDAPPGPPGILDYIANVVAVVDALRGQGVLPHSPVDLMGYHTGGVIAAALATRYPRLVRRLVLVSLAGFTPDERAARLRQMHIFPVPQEDDGNIAALLAIGATLHDKRLDPEWRHRALGEMLGAGARMPWGFRAVYEHDMLADLRAVRQAALVLCPRDDLWDATHANIGLLAKARLVEFPDAGNGFLDLDTLPVADLIAGFLA